MLAVTRALEVQVHRANPREPALASGRSSLARRCPTSQTNSTGVSSSPCTVWDQPGHCGQRTPTLQERHAVSNLRFSARCAPRNACHASWKDPCSRSYDRRRAIMHALSLPGAVDVKAMEPRAAAIDILAPAARAAGPPAQIQPGLSPLCVVAVQGRNFLRGRQCVERCAGCRRTSATTASRSGRGGPSGRRRPSWREAHGGSGPS